MKSQLQSAAVCNMEVADHVHVMTVAQQRLAADAASNFRKLIKSQIDEGARKIVIDLSNVDFIDSLGIGAIVAAKKALSNQGELVLAGASRNVLTMFKLTRLDKEFQILNTRDDAIHSLTN